MIGDKIIQSNYSFTLKQSFVNVRLILCINILAIGALMYYIIPYMNEVGSGAPIYVIDVIPCNNMLALGAPMYCIIPYVNIVALGAPPLGL